MCSPPSPVCSRHSSARTRTIETAHLRDLENILDIVGIESSDGLLNRGRYGFDPNA
jgi:hypothetical protein